MKMMFTCRYLAASLLLLGSSITFADSVNQGFLMDFLPGTYTLIGRAIDAETSYTGKAIIIPQQQGFAITRRIGSKTVEATGRIEQATADRLDVLRLRFSEGDQALEATCLIGSDLDNYPRLSCQLYRSDGSTQRPGLEAWFIQHAP